MHLGLVSLRNASKNGFVITGKPVITNPDRTSEPFPEMVLSGSCRGNEKRDAESEMDNGDTVADI